MIMHEECLEGIYESIQKLKQLAPRTNAVSQSKQVNFFFWFARSFIISLHWVYPFGNKLEMPL